MLRGGLPGVRFQDAAEGLGANDLLRIPVSRRIVDLAIERQVVQRLVRPVSVVIVQVRLDEIPKVVFAKNNEMIKRLDLERR